MEIIMISESKLKVMLTSEDLQSFELDTEDLDYSNTETKRMFWDILGRAKHSIGFDTDGQRVLVQLYPSRSGGCEMFITKLGSTVRCEHTGTEETDLHTLIKTQSDRPSAAKPRVGAFGFDALSHLLAVCRRLCGIGYTGESEAFVADDDRTYLFLSIPESSCYLTLDEYSFIAEYGTHENTDALRRFLLEHGKSICRPNAVEVLAKF